MENQNQLSPIYLGKYINEPKETLIQELVYLIDDYRRRISNMNVPQGYKIKRTPEMQLIDKDLFSPMRMIEEFRNILENKSNLSSNLRNTITKYIVQAIVNLNNKEQSSNNQ